MYLCNWILCERIGMKQVKGVRKTTYGVTFPQYQTAKRFVNDLTTDFWW